MRDLWIGTALAVAAGMSYTLERCALILARSIEKSGSTSWPTHPQFSYLATNVAVWVFAALAAFFFYRGLQRRRDGAEPRDAMDSR